MSPETVLALGLLGLAVGAFGTIVGAGGGFILTPVLLIVYPHEPAETIAAIGLAAVFFNASSGSLAYWRQRRIDIRSGGVFALATLPGAVVGALLVGLMPRRAFDVLMAILLLGMAVWLELGGRQARAPQHRPRGHLVERVLVDATGHEYRYGVALWRGAAYSTGVGLVSSLLGIGGGIIHVPLLVRALGFPTHLATATSHFVLAIMSGAGTLTHVLAGSFAHGHGLRRAAVLGATVAVGAQAGAYISPRLSARAIEQALAVSLVVLGARLIITAA